MGCVAERRMRETSVVVQGKVHEWAAGVGCHGGYVLRFGWIDVKVMKELCDAYMPLKKATMWFWTGL